jgi:hypothetical protein
MNLYNILERAFWAFIEAAAATFIAVEVVFDLETLQSAAFAAAVAGGSAVLSMLKTVAQERLVVLAVKRDLP